MGKGKKKNKTESASEKVIAVCESAQYLSIDELQSHPDNPRTISRDRLDDLKRSIVEKGIYQPFLVWSKGNIVLAGNQRTRACLELIDEGYSFGEENKVPVVIEDVSEDMAEAILFDSNNSYGGWVEEKLAVAVAQAKEAGKNLQQWGFSAKAVDDLLKDAMKGAEDITSKTTVVPEHERTSGGKSKDKDDEGEITEKQEALILPKSVFLKLTDIFQDIAYQLDPTWRDGMSLVPAIEKFIEFTYAEGVPDVQAWLEESAKKDSGE